MKNARTTAKQRLIQRLSAAHPGWPIYDKLLQLVNSLPFEDVEIEYVGRFLASDSRLVFREVARSATLPKWLPPYVAALYGMMADDCEMEGGYAAHATHGAAKKGAVFSPAGNDAALGFTEFEVPADIYRFQANVSGALFFVNRSLQIVYPNADRGQFEVLDSLEAFTMTNIRQAIDGRRWFQPYSKAVAGRIID